MKPGRAFSFMTGVALLGAIAKFNEMTPTAQASLLGNAAETARTTARSWLQNAVVIYNDLAGGTDAAPAGQRPPERHSTPAAPPNPNVSQPVVSAQEGREGEGAPPQQRVATRTDDAEPPPPAQEGHQGIAAPRQRVAARTDNADLRASAANPLWVLPLKQLSSTRDRPIFSPSRRPPPPATTLVAPVAVRQPVKPAEPDRPMVSLLGTIIGIDERIGVFLESGTQSIVRLRVGDEHQGWMLRLIKAREVTLVKNHEQVAVLEMPPPGDAPVGGVPLPGGVGMQGGVNMPGAAGTQQVQPLWQQQLQHTQQVQQQQQQHQQQQPRRQGR